MGKTYFNLFNLANSICTNHKDIVTRKNITMECNVSKGLVVFFNKELFHSLLYDCLSSAIHSSVNNCTIAINCTLHMGNLELTIMNKLNSIESDRCIDDLRHAIKTKNENSYSKKERLDISLDIINKKYLLVTIAWPFINAAL